MNIRPLRNKVALKEFNKESRTGSGLVLMGDLGDTVEYGVVAVGPDVICVNVGDSVLIEPGKGVVVNGDTVMIEDKYITAVLND